MTDILLHGVRKAAAGGVVHTYLIDIGAEIEIHGIGPDSVLSSTPFFTSRPVTGTRFFEIVLDATRRDALSSIRDIHVQPVHAERTGGFSLFGFVILGGKWVVTDRPGNTPPANVQWTYTDDFNLLHVTSGDTDPSTMAGLIIDRINAIAKSIRSGTRAPSHAENRQTYRESIYSFVTDSRESGDWDTPAPVARPAPAIPGRARCLPSSGHAGDLPGAVLANIVIPSMKLAAIEEINDASWLFE